LTNVGWNASVRTVKYDEPVIQDVTFGSIFFALSSLRARSDINMNLGTTYVERENGQSTEEFAGNLSWLVNLTSRSRMRTYIATDLTDSSEGALNATVDPEVGDPNNIQITTDVIRYQVISLGYYRQDGTLDSSLTGELSKINYSESPNDRIIWNVNAVLSYPVTALLSSGFYARHNNTDNIDTNRIDNNFTIGGGIRYQLSRNLHSQFDLKYRDRDSTLETENFEEWSVYASITYGFGQSLRPSRSGGF
jgi:predicted porin